MSQENVEIVRSLIEAFNQDDRAGFIGLTDPTVEWWDRDDDPGATVHRGHDGVSAFLAELGDDVELQLEPLKFIEADDLVVVQLRLVGRGRTSGIRLTGTRST
jgi:ketosteroid isomerase-like protein